MDSINNNINFTARMDVSKVALNKSRWQKIAELFEQKTQNYPHDTFQIEELPCSISAYNLNSKSGEEISADFSGVIMDKLMNMSDEQIVSKFKKLLSISNKQAKLYEKTQKFINSALGKNDDKTEEKIWDVIVEKACADSQAAIQKDSFLKNADIIL